MRILLVDDHAIVREGLQELLAALPDAQISEAATVDEALARVRDEQPTVIVLDFHLPGASCKIGTTSLSPQYIVAIRDVNVLYAV